MFFCTKEAIYIEYEELYNIEDIEQGNHKLNKGVFNLYTFYTSSHIMCVIVGILMAGEIEGELCFYEVPIQMDSYAVDFFGRPCILTIDDFTQFNKTKSVWKRGAISEFSIEKQIDKIIDMNNRKHKQIERQEQKIREQEAQMTLMQSIISSMQIQLQEQCKLIASLQLSLNETQREMRKKQVAIEEEVDILLRDE